MPAAHNIPALPTRQTGMQLFYPSSNANLLLLYYKSIFLKMKAISYTFCSSKRNGNRAVINRCFMLFSVSLLICPFSCIDEITYIANGHTVKMENGVLKWTDDGDVWSSGAIRLD
jgi:hypothetical protein